VKAIFNLSPQWFSSGAHLDVGFQMGANNWAMGGLGDVGNHTDPQIMFFFFFFSQWVKMGVLIIFFLKIPVGQIMSCM